MLDVVVRKEFENWHITNMVNAGPAHVPVDCDNGKVAG
jgi:hypothetical protein